MSLTLDTFMTRYMLLQPDMSAQVQSGRHAAVLVPVVEREQPGLLLTLRASHLRKHAGQVAFPGGMRDIDDDTLIDTALRETQEEVGIPASQVKILGYLPAVTSSTGFQVTPVLGIIPATAALQLNPDEVESAFEMPLAEALRLSRYTALEIHRAGHRLPVWFSWYQDYLVWGMTAGIIRSLGQQIAL